MSDPALDPASSPTSLDPGAGVRRLNKLPLAALGGGALLAALALAYAAAQRGATTPSAESGPVEVEVRDSPSFNDVIAGHEETVEIVAAPEEPPEPVTPVPTPAPPPPPDPRLAELEEYRLDLLRDALAAPSAVESPSYGAQHPEEPAAADPRSLLLDRLAAAANAGEPVAIEDDPNLRRRKDEFAATGRRFGPSFERREPPAAAHEIKAGTVIPAVLISGINSDLPGMVTAQVSTPVRDTRTGAAILIPQGSRLIGAYDHHVALGQRRVMVAWHRLQFPDASTLDLGGMPGTDPAGAAGFKDKVDTHFVRAFGAATMLSAIAAGTQLSQPRREGDGTGYPTAEEQLAAEAGRQWGELGRETARRNLNVQPTLRVRPGYRLRVLVTQDLALEPYAAYST